MNLTPLFEAQAQLDARITDEPKLQERCLALLVEIGEAANDEQRSWKFWKKHNDPKGSLLEELVDCLHFILSIGNHIGVPRHYHFEEPAERNRNIQDAWLSMFRNAAHLAYFTKRAPWHDTFTAYVHLVYSLGFKWYDVEEAYYAKNRENFARQERGY